MTTSVARRSKWTGKIPDFSLVVSIEISSKETKLFAVGDELGTSLEPFQGVEFRRCMEGEDTYSSPCSCSN